MFLVKRLIVVLVALVLTMTPRITSAASNFVVNSGADDHDYVINGVCETQNGNGVCTLRAALDEINAAGGGWHHILIAPMTISLSSQNGELPLKSGVHVLMSGAGTATVIDAGNHFGVRIFNVDSGAWLRLSNLTLANGNVGCCGAGIENRGIVYLQKVVLSGHLASSSGMGGNAGRGAAIFNESSGVLTVENSTFTNSQSRGSGGAIRNEGLLTVVKSTFVSNDAYAGGGGAIANIGRAYIYTSTFSANHSAGAGAIWNDFGGQVYIYSSTFADNYTHSNAPSNTLSNSGSMVLLNTIVYASPGGTNCNGTVISWGYNLSNDTSCNFGRRGDQQGGDPKLAPLANNGGPTQTRKLLVGSAAIDTGFCVGSDQRGYRRPVNILPRWGRGNNCDIGSFELQRNEVR